MKDFTTKLKYIMKLLKDKLVLYIKRSPITAILVLLNTLMLILTLVTGGFSVANLAKLGGLIPARVKENNEYYRLLLAIFLHGSILHFFFNTYFLHYFGSFVEDLLGKFKFIVIYLLSGLGSSLLVLFLGDPYVITIGASGALFGVLGALLILTFIKTKWFHPNTVKSIRNVSVLNLIFTFLMPNISVLGHLGGFITGAILIYLLTPNKPSRQRTYSSENEEGNIIIDHVFSDEDEVNQ